MNLCNIYTASFQKEPFVNGTLANSKLLAQLTQK